MDVDVDAFAHGVDAGHGGLLDDYESFKTVMAAKVDLGASMEEEDDDDDEFWQCRGFAATQRKESVRVMDWMEGCEGGSCMNMWTWQR